MNTKLLTSSMKVKEVTETGIIKGYLNTFNYKDHADDVTLKGAFTKSLLEIAESGRPLPMLWSHQHDKPIGTWHKLVEDEYGLYAEGQLTMEVTQAKEAYALAKQGALSGISIGYFVINERYDSGTNTNYLIEVSLIEASLVVFPCSETSRIDEVKQKMKENQLPSKRELEAALKEAGFSNSQSKAIAANYSPESSKSAPSEKGGYYMKECLKEPVLSVACLGDVLWFLPPQTHVQLIEVAEAGRLEQVAAMKPVEQEVKAVADPATTDEDVEVLTTDDGTKEEEPEELKIDGELVEEEDQEPEEEIKSAMQSFFTK